MKRTNNEFNGIGGMSMTPMAMGRGAHKRISQSSDYSVSKDFMREYNNHIAAMQIVAMCAKVYIRDNWKKVKDWSNLNVIINCSNKQPAEFYNYVKGRGRRKIKWAKEVVNTFEKLEADWDKENKKRHNPVKSISEVVLDVDWDFSLTVNGESYFWLSDDSVIVIAAYIEKQLSNGKT